MASASTSGKDRRDQLLELGLALAADLSLPTVLQRIIELAVELTGARYGALGVLGPNGRIRQFITVGITAEDRRHQIQLEMRRHRRPYTPSRRT